MLSSKDFRVQNYYTDGSTTYKYIGPDDASTDLNFPEILIFENMAPLKKWRMTLNLLYLYLLVLKSKLSIFSGIRLFCATIVRKIKSVKMFNQMITSIVRFSTPDLRLLPPAGDKNVSSAHLWLCARMIFGD